MNIKIGPAEAGLLLLRLFLLVLVMALGVVLIRYLWNKGSESKKNSKTKKD